MELAPEISAIEDALSGRNITLSTVLATAGIDRSTWTRWKAGKTLPQMRTWLDLKAAVADACCAADIAAAKATRQGEAAA